MSMLVFPYLRTQMDNEKVLYLRYKAKKLLGGLPHPLEVF